MSLKWWRWERHVNHSRSVFECVHRNHGDVSPPDYTRRRYLWLMYNYYLAMSEGNQLPDQLRWWLPSFQQPENGPNSNSRLILKEIEWRFFFFLLNIVALLDWACLEIRDVFRHEKTLHSLKCHENIVGSTPTIRGEPGYLLRNSAQHRRRLWTDPMCIFNSVAYI